MSDDQKGGGHAAVEILRLAEDRDAYKATAEESQKLLGEFAVAFARLHDEALTPCEGDCPGHLGPKASVAFREALGRWHRRRSLLERCIDPAVELGEADLVAEIRRELGSSEGTSTASRDGAWLILEECKRQVAVEGWTAEHDDQHTEGELARAGAAYALRSAHWTPQAIAVWPWRQSYWKPRSPLRDLVRAGALIAAEINRRLRAGEALEGGAA